MPSIAFIWWQTTAATDLDEVEAAHAAVGGTGPGRRHATRQLNNAYVMLLSSQFQRFCRDLHTQASDRQSAMVPLALQAAYFTVLTGGRKLDVGNPNPGNIGSDYERLGLKIWQQSVWATPSNSRQRKRLEALNLWRNAIAHQDYGRPACGGRTAVTLSEVKSWRVACSELALVFDRLTRDHLLRMGGVAPW